ncbi:MAG: metallopeptidase family protein [Bacteroidota bacterium]
MSPFRVDQEEFEQMAHEAFESLPEEIRSRIENLFVVVEDTPCEETMQKMGLRSREELLGLYEGIPLDRRGEHYGSYPVVPDRVTLFKRNIEAVCNSRGAVRRKVRDVLIHEIAHHYGFDEDDVREAGY